MIQGPEIDQLQGTILMVLASPEMVFACTPLSWLFAYADPACFETLFASN